MASAVAGRYARGVTNNDVLRRLRYVFDLNDTRMIAMWTHAGYEVSRAKMSDWLKRDDDPAFVECPDEILAMFLNGLITDRRGQREGPTPPVEKRLSNNAIFTKLKIACALGSDDVLEIIQSAGHTVTKPELSAFFRKPGHKHYRECQDQVLRNFLKGLQLKYRGAPAADAAAAAEVADLEQ